jgi:4-hydroxythreonine-4-phosphate dehydrogenase|tara:strand:- start:359 stop:1327 length:969 start_codon:yes stop_codon:yes gene_type:complete
MKKKIAIILGEPNSVNSEIIAKMWNLLEKSLKKNIFIIGNYTLLKEQLRIINLNVPLNKITNLNEFKSKNALQVLNVPLNFKNPFKINNFENSKYIFSCFNIAHNLAIKKKIFSFINCPINKKKLFLKNKIGITEFLAKKNKVNGSEVMLIYGKKFSVVPITTHIKLKNVSRILKKNTIEKKIITINNFYKKKFKKRPVLAILGLNPHNDEFRAGSEEQKIIIPVINKLKKRKIKLLGPFPADTIFSNQKKYNYDVIIGMYHDQVLAPFKALNGYNAINVTLGLKYLRASPDHGTAVDLIGLNKANAKSLIMSVQFLFQIAK